METEIIKLLVQLPVLAIFVWWVSKSNNRWGSVHLGDKKCLFNRPAVINSGCDTFFVQFKKNAPVSKTPSLAIEGNHFINSLVPRLFSKSSPATILLTIISVVVNPLKSCLSVTKGFNMIKIRAMKIISEILKRSPEALNSTSSIIRIRNCVRVVASSFHSLPNSIKISGRESMFSDLTTATSRCSSLYVVNPDYFKNTTITPKEPVIMTINPMLEFNCLNKTPLFSFSYI